MLPTLVGNTRKVFMFSIYFKTFSETFKISSRKPTGIKLRKLIFSHLKIHNYIKNNVEEEYKFYIDLYEYDTILFSNQSIQQILLLTKKYNNFN